MYRIAILALVAALGCGDQADTEERTNELHDGRVETLCNSTGYRVVVYIEDGVIWEPFLEETVCQAPLACRSGFGNLPCQ